MTMYAFEDPPSTGAEPAPHPSEPRAARRGGHAHASVAVHELTAGGLTWVNAVAPDLETAQALAERFGWHPLDVEDIVSKRQRPKVDDYEDDGLPLRRPPLPGLRQGDPAPERRRARRLHRPGLPRHAPEPRAAARSRASSAAATPTTPFREQLFRKGSGRLLYEVLDDLFDYCFPILDKIGHKLDRIEDDMFEGYAEDVVRDISNVKQEIISYRKVMKPERPTLRVLERRVDRFLPEELELYFDDLIDAAERIWDQLDNYKEVVEGLESTNESVISHRQNDVLRLLTLISVTMLPLTLITSIFGMNVALPRRGDARGVLGDRRRPRGDAGGMVGFFRWKRWI